MKPTRLFQHNQTDRDLNLLGYVFIKLKSFMKTEKPSEHQLRKEIREFHNMETKQLKNETLTQSN